jgi:hypothetical protein
MMPDNLGLRIINAQLLDELKKRMLLQLSPRIRSFTVLIKPTFITNCYWAVVIAYGMNTLHTLWEYRYYTAVPAHIIMIRRLTESLTPSVD